MKPLFQKRVMDVTVFGENLKRLRLERNMSQDDLALLLGTSKQVISRYETGQRSPKVSVVAAYAEKLGVSISMLTTGEDADDPAQARQDVFDDPDRRALLNLARHGSPEAVRQVAAVIDALHATNPDFYDGDDPA